jgi:hypothetical protein
MQSPNSTELNLMEYNFAYSNSGLATNGAASGSYDYGAGPSCSSKTPVPVTHFSYDNPDQADVALALCSRKYSVSTSQARLSKSFRRSASVKDAVADIQRPPPLPRKIHRSRSQWERPSIETAAPGDAGLDSNLPDDRQSFFRADRRKPHVVFTNGFYPKGPREDLVRYVKYNHPSNFVSMTSSPEAAVTFATQKSGAKHIYKVGMEADHPKLVDVNKYFKELGIKNPRSEEHEFVVKGEIPSSNVFGSQRINMAGKPIGQFEYNNRYK